MLTSVKCPCNSSVFDVSSKLRNCIPPCGTTHAVLGCYRSSRFSPRLLALHSSNCYFLLYSSLCPGYSPQPLILAPLRVFRCPTLQPRARATCLCIFASPGTIHASTTRYTVQHVRPGVLRGLHALPSEVRATRLLSSLLSICVSRILIVSSSQSLPLCVSPCVNPGMLCASPRLSRRSCAQKMALIEVPCGYCDKLYRCVYRHASLFCKHSGLYGIRWRDTLTRAIFPQQSGPSHAHVQV